jgi:predicted acylesterase/phospholipase RssA
MLSSLIFREPVQGLRPRKTVMVALITVFLSNYPLPSLADQEIGSATQPAAPSTKSASAPTPDCTTRTSPQAGASENRRRLVLVLGGGGTRGAAHIGVLRELDRHQVRIDAIVGTSIGAIVGGLYCSGLSPDKIEEIILGKSFLRSYLTVPIPVRVIIAPILLLPRLIGFHAYDGLYRGNRFAAYIDSKIPSKNKDIENLPTAYGAVCSDLLTATPYMIEKGDIGRAIQASAAIPALRKPVPYDPEHPNQIPGTRKHPQSQKMVLLIDGGLQANLPVELGRQLAQKLINAELSQNKNRCQNQPVNKNEDGPIILAVNVDESFSRIDPDTFRKMGSVSQRVASMILVQVDKPSLSQAVLMIQPDTNGISLLSTKRTDSLRAIQKGEEAAREALPKLMTLLHLAP